MNSMFTQYKLSYGASGRDIYIAETSLYFHCNHQSDLCVRFAEKVIEFDRDDRLSAAWVRIWRLPDTIYPQGCHVTAWTKTSDERPTEEGSEVPL